MLVVSCLGVTSYAQERYLGDDQVDFTRILEPAPKLNSEVAKADLEVSESWQAKRTERDCERVVSEVRVNLQALFGPPDGPLSAAEVNRFTPFFAHVKLDGAYFSEAAKKHWRRLRPYLQYKQIRLCPDMDRPGDFSYPSGHSTDSRLFALVLSEIFPARRKFFLARSDQVAEDRVIAGAHYASDIEAGKKLGDAIFAALLRNDSFLEDLRKQK